MLFTDTVSVSGVRQTADGYIVGDAKVARSGVQVYLGIEVGKPNEATVRVYRPENEVFSVDAMQSYAYRPMTDGHPDPDKYPDRMVNSENWNDLSVGQTGGEVARDGDFVRVPMVLMDQATIDSYQSGKCELSMGYTSDLVFQDGETPQGEKYDAIQTNLRMNHLALVTRARGGDQLKLGDEQKGDNPMTDSLRKVLVDGLQVETTDAGAQAIVKLQSDLKASQELMDEAETNHKQALADKDSELAQKDSEIQKLTDAQVSDADLDAKVRARAELLSTAKVIHDADYSGKSDDEIRKIVVSAKCGDESVAEKTDEYINARFDILADSVKEQQVDDPFRKTVIDGGIRTQHNDGWDKAANRAGVKLKEAS